MSPYSRSIQELDCPTRMFIASLCLTDADLDAIEFLPGTPECPVSRATAARSVLHRLCASEPRLARGVTDLLDLRHAAAVGHVRAQDPVELAAQARSRAESASGEELAGWAWALLTDPRPRSARSAGD